MGVSEFIDEHLEVILADWEAFAATCLPAAHYMTSAQLRDGAAAILRAIADDLRTAQSRQQQRQKSRGLLPGNSPNLSTAAREHAEDRFANGFDLEQLVAEYRALRSNVGELWEDELGEAPDGYEMTRFNEAVDQVLAESVGSFAKSLNRARDLYLGVLSHDLRNPLGAIALTAKVVLADPALKEDHRRVLAQIPKSSDRMEELINNLLEFTRAQLGTGIPISPQSSDLAETVRHVVDEMSSRNPDHSIDVRVEGDVSGTWDTRRIEQALSNLVSNAVKHGAADRPVTIGVRGTTDQVTLTVHNFGEPVSADTFRAVKGALQHGPMLEGGTETSQSVRLGLYIVRQILESHSGTITLSSTEEAGTEFTIRLPRHVPKPTVPGSP